jgi:hypothetical protein
MSAFGTQYVTHGLRPWVRGPSCNRRARRRGEGAAHGRRAAGPQGRRAAGLGRLALFGGAAGLFTCDPVVILLGFRWAFALFKLEEYQCITVLSIAGQAFMTARPLS